jgi:hypothetical protein
MDAPTDDTRRALEAAAQAHAQATTSLTDTTGVLDTILGSLSGIFQSLSGLSPPIAALCVAVLMFLTAGGIEVANRLIH